MAFDIKRATGQLITKVALDYEGPSLVRSNCKGNRPLRG